MIWQVYDKSCSDKYFKDMVTSQNIFVINGNADLNTLTVAEAKKKAKAAGQPGVVAIFQGKVDENWDGDVKWDMFNHDGAWNKMNNCNIPRAAQAARASGLHPPTSPPEPSVWTVHRLSHMCCDAGCCAGCCAFT